MVILIIVMMIVVLYGCAWVLACIDDSYDLHWTSAQILSTAHRMLDDNKK